MADDWGCNVDLFGESSKTSSKSLTELVDSLTKKNLNGARQNAQPTPQEAENVKIIALKRNGANKIPMVHAPKILKKKKANGHNNNNNNIKVLNDANPKRVHFDVRLSSFCHEKQARATESRLVNECSLLWELLRRSATTSTTRI